MRGSRLCKAKKDKPRNDRQDQDRRKDNRGKKPNWSDQAGQVGNNWGYEDFRRVLTVAENAGDQNMTTHVGITPMNGTYGTYNTKVP